jgi:hypothetical protein
MYPKFTVPYPANFFVRLSHVGNEYSSVSIRQCAFFCSLGKIIAFRALADISRSPKLSRHGGMILDHE